MMDVHRSDGELKMCAALITTHRREASPEIYLNWVRFHIGLAKLTQQCLELTRCCTFLIWVRLVIHAFAEISIVIGAGIFSPCRRRCNRSRSEEHRVGKE